MTNQPPTLAQLNDACLSYRHDFGLMDSADVSRVPGEVLCRCPWR